MKRILITVSMLFVALSAPLAAEKVEGYLVDKACSAKVVKGGVDAAKAHTKDCALMPNCKESGYGVVTADSGAGPATPRPAWPRSSRPSSACSNGARFDAT